VALAGFSVVWGLQRLLGVQGLGACHAGGWACGVVGLLTHPTFERNRSCFNGFRGFRLFFVFSLLSSFLLLSRFAGGVSDWLPSLVNTPLCRFLAQSLQTS
jgi:hypothetical protein